MLSILSMSASLCTAAPGYYGVLIWGLTGVVMVLLLGFALLWFRRKYHPGGMSGDNKASIFSMKDIEDMRAGGMISDDEFRLLRAASLGLEAPDADNDNSILSMPNDVDDGTEELVSHNEPQDHKEIT